MTLRQGTPPTGAVKEGAACCGIAPIRKEACRVAVTRGISRSRDLAFQVVTVRLTPTSDN